MRAIEAHCGNPGNESIEQIMPLDTSSHDLLADRRADYAEMLFADGDVMAAVSLIMDALERAPAWPFGWYRLGEFYEAVNDTDKAVEAWQMALRLDPADHAGATLKLALAGAIAPLDRPPSAFVEALFDQYADRFEKSLVEKLGYRVPDALFSAITAVHPDRFALARDLGCGTGLMGERLRPVTGRLEGFDISGEMLRKARAKKVYDHLQKADLQSLPHFDAPADLVTAADVFMYLGALDNVFAGVSAMQESGALFAFSVERHEGAEDFVLLDTRRYAHSRACLERLLEQNGYRPVSMENQPIRMDRSAAIEGILTVAQKL